MPDLMTTTDTSPLRLGDKVFSAADLFSILNGVADSVIVQDPTGRIILANDIAARSYGFASLEDMVGTFTKDLRKRFEVFDSHGASVPSDEMPGSKALRGAVEQEQLVRFRTAGGTDKWVTLKSEPVFDADGNVRFAINIAHDVTDVMNRQQMLEQNTAQLEDVTAELEQTIAELQERTHEAEAAKADAEYIGERHRFLAEAGRLLAASLNPEETLRMITHLVVPRIADWCTISLLDNEGIPQQLEVAHADPDKLRFALDVQKRYPPDVEDTMRVVRSGKTELYPEIPDEMLAQTARDDEHLRILRELQLKSAMVVPLKIRDQVLGVITFISSGRAYGEDDREFAESLAARSALALMNARLFTQAQSANQTKADFLAVMSHELRTPLTAIFGYTELLATGITGPLNEKQAKQLERIRSSASHLLSIIEDILNYARSEAGEDQVRSENVLLSDVVRESLNIVQPAAREKGLSLKHELRQDCVLKTDRAKVRQVLINLLGNAVKFTKEGSVEIVAECDAQQATLVVRDTGVGIAEKDLELVFEPFRQLQSATTRTEGGTGLGLAVTKRFLDLLGGSIEVESTVGKGTAFTVRIPVG
jgi:PAS domain S-box-containing protein